MSHPELTNITLDDVLEALGDPTRRAILRRLSTDGDRACGTFGIDLAPSTLSYHFRVLREAGIIRQYDVGRRRMNSLRSTELARRFPGLLEAVLGSDDGSRPAAPRS